MPLWVASTTTARPARKRRVRHHGQGRAGWRRATRQAPHRYAAAAAPVAAVTTGANSHWVTTACQPNAGSMRPPSGRAYLVPWQVTQVNWDVCVHLGQGARTDTVAPASPPAGPRLLTT